MMVLNRDGHVFIGRRIEGPEHIDATHVWQMPQGGIDEGEDPYPRRCASCYEETSIRSVEKARRDRGMAHLRHPARIASQAWKGKYRGQKQKWYALRFTGNDGEIDIAHPGGGHKPEFVEWRWEPMRELARPGHAVQAADLRAGGEGIFEVRQARAMTQCDRRAGSGARVERLEVIEPRDQLVERGARLHLLDAAFQLADARCEHAAVDVSTASATSASTVSPSADTSAKPPSTTIFCSPPAP